MEYFFWSLPRHVSQLMSACMFVLFFYSIFRQKYALRFTYFLASIDKLLLWQISETIPDPMSLGIALGLDHRNQLIPLKREMDTKRDFAHGILEVKYMLHDKLNPYNIYILRCGWSKHRGRELNISCPSWRSPLIDAIAQKPFECWKSTKSSN